MTDTFSLTDVGINQGIKRKDPPPRIEEIKKPAPPPPIEKIIITQREQTPPPAPAPMPPQRLFRSDSEDEGITNKEMEKKKYDWEKIKRKVHDPFVKPDTFYRDYPILPGYGFYKALINAKNMPLEVLDVNIPDTIINTDTQVMMYRDETTGRLTKKVEASFHDFEQRLVKTVKGFNLNDQGDSRDNTAMTGRDMPLAIQRIANNDNGLCQKKVLNYREIEGRRMYMVEPFSFYQKFVMPKGFRASILRLVFYTSNSTEQKGNYGYRMTNHSDIFDPDQTKSLMTKSTLSTDIENSFGITLVKGASLKEFEVMATKVVKFLERAYSVRILDCVFDFITDFEGINWLVNMKCLQIDPKSIQNLEMAATRIKKDLDDLTCSVYCKLCMMIFKKDDASRTLTYKLMWELVQHLKKRGIQLNDIVVKHASTKPCRICDLCYMLVVSEHELIDIEQRIARAQNIPLGEGIYRVQSDTKPMHRPPLLADKLYQWRLMFYINYIGDLANHPKIGRYGNLHIQFKFGETKSVFPLKFLKSSKKPPKLAYKDDFTAMRKQQMQARQAASAAKLASPNYNLSGFSTMPNNTQSVKTLKKEEVTNHLHVEKDTYYDLRLLRVFYIFSETTDIEKFLKETQMTIRITEGTDWNNFISEGAVYPLRTFRNQMKDGQRVENEVLCFFENEKYCVLHMTEGLVCDGVYRTENLNLYKYNNVYFPDDDYFNSNPFPPEWMEIFEESEKLIEDDLARENQIISYTPKCSTREIKKMVDFEMGTKKLSNIKSQTKMLWTQGANSNTTLKPQNMTTGTFETFHLVDQNKLKNHDMAAGTAPLMSRPFSAAELGGVRKKNIDYTSGKIRTIKDNGRDGRDSRAATGKNRDVYVDILSKPPGEEENKELDNQIKQLQKYYTQPGNDGEKNTSAQQGQSQINNDNEVSKNIRKIILESGGNRSIEEEDILKKYERVSLEEQERKLRSAKEEQSKKAPKNEMPVLPHDILAMGGHDLSRDGNRKL